MDFIDKIKQLSERIAFIGDDKKEIAHKITCIDDIYNYTEDIVSAANKFA